MKVSKGKNGDAVAQSGKDAKEIKAKAEEKKRVLRVKKEQKGKKQQKEMKTKKDPNQPKKPPTAFFFYMEDFRKIYQEKNPKVKSMRAIGKACGIKWKEMKYEEKAPYFDKATQKRAEYEKSLTAYKKKKEAGEEAGLPDESDKPNSKEDKGVDDNEESGEEDDED